MCAYRDRDDHDPPDEVDLGRVADDERIFVGEIQENGRWRFGE